MDGFGARRRTAATAAAVLTVLALATTPSALAQSAGDRQYADPLVTDGDDRSGQRTPSPGDDADERPAPAPSPASGDGSDDATDDSAAASPDAGAAVDPAPPAEAALPRTGAEPLDLALAGLALAACGALGLALPRRARHARR